MVAPSYCAGAFTVIVKRSPLFDWAVLRGWTAPVPWVLAGGLTPATVGDAIRRTGAAVVDVSSGVERSRGVKDPALIHAFVEAVRRGHVFLHNAST